MRLMRMCNLVSLSLSASLALILVFVSVFFSLPSVSTVFTFKGIHNLLLLSTCILCNFSRSERVHLSCRVVRGGRRRKKSTWREVLGEGSQVECEREGERESENTCFRLESPATLPLPVDILIQGPILFFLAMPFTRKRARVYPRI